MEFISLKVNPLEWSSGELKRKKQTLNCRAALLISQGLVDELIHMPSNIVQNAGLRVVRTSKARIELEPYDQLLFAVAGKYYSSLPEVGIDTRTLQMLHLCYLDSEEAESNKLSPYPPSVVQVLKIANDELIIYIITKLARLIFEGFRVKENDMSGIDSTILSDLFASFEPARGVYKMCYQLTHGGLAAVEPIPSLIQGSPVLREYVNCIATGAGSINISDVVMNPRLTTSVVIQPPVPRSAIIPPKIPVKTTGVKRPRDTTDFQQKESMNQATLTSLTEGTNALISEMRSVKDKITTIEGMLTSLSNTLAILVTQSQYSRVLAYRMLLAEELDSTTGDDVTEELVNRLKKALIDAGRQATAECVTLERLRHHGSTKRWAANLRSMV